MSAAEVGRMHVRCTAPRMREGEALALRTRLEQTAHTHLPGALEPVLARRGERVFAERVFVRLGFDPSAYDDVTVAALWAGCVDAALAGGDAEAGAAEGVRRFGSDREFDAAALAEAAATGRLSWMFAELGCGTGVVPVSGLLTALAGLGRRRARAVAAVVASRPDVARGLHDRLAPDEREATLGAFERALGGAAPLAGPLRSKAVAERPAGLPDGPRVKTPAADGRKRGARPASLETWRAAFGALARDADPVGRLVPAESQEPADGERRRPASVEAEPPAPAAPAGEREDEPELRFPEPSADLPDPVEPLEPEEAWWSRVAGLAFLYPWLAEYLDEPPPDVPPLAGRMWALARLADPTDESLLSDPLVRLLSGDDLEREGAEPLRPGGLEALDGPAERLLASFAGEIPGFAESTPGFVRAHFLARGGLLEPLGGEGFRLVLEPAPLDPILDLLPYPVESFRLPWSPTIFVRRKERDARP
jgi:hypothetical protein